MVGNSSRKVAGDLEGEALKVARTIGTAEGLKLLRQRKGWTQLRLAQEAGVRMPGISEYETGKMFPAVPTLARLLDAMQATVVDLFVASREAGGEVREGMVARTRAVATGGSDSGRDMEALMRVIIRQQEELEALKG